ncbi:MAG: hypothetical protein PHW82_14770 [Bacteroidales bacterium]|nr:hypothetical protein [Bacteroidales bacterium]
MEKKSKKRLSDLAIESINLNLMKQVKGGDTQTCECGPPQVICSCELLPGCTPLPLPTCQGTFCK